MVLYGCAHVPDSMDPHGLMLIGNRIFRMGCPWAAPFVEKKVPNRHEPNVIDTIKTTSCDGVELSTYVGILASRPTGLPIYLVVRKSHSELPDYMNVGRPVRGLLDVLGKPSEQNESSVTYRVGEADDSVTFSLGAGKITSIRWEWYLD